MIIWRIRGIDSHKNGIPIKIAHIAVAGGAGAELLVRCSFVAYHIAVHIHGWNSFCWHSIACQIYLIRITWRSAISTLTNAKFNQKTRKFIWNKISRFIPIDFWLEIGSLGTGVGNIGEIKSIHIISNMTLSVQSIWQYVDCTRSFVLLATLKYCAHVSSTFFAFQASIPNDFGAMVLVRFSHVRIDRSKCVCGLRSVVK